MRPIYSNIAKLLQIESADHLTNLVVDRSNGVLADWDVQEQLLRHVEMASRVWDGYVRDHMTLPTEPAIISLAGTMVFENGTRIVIGTGTQFTTELQVDDWIQPDDNYNAIHIVRRIVSDTELELTCNFFAESITGEGTEGPTASRYDHGVSPDVVDMINCYACYLLWRHRGRRQDEDNPFVTCKEVFDQRVVEIQEGRFRFDSEDAGVIARKPSLSGERYDSTDKAEYLVNQDSMEGFYGD